MTAEALEQSVLESKDKEQLTAIAQALGIKTTARLKKADIIVKILESTGAFDTPSANGSSSPAIDEPPAPDVVEPVLELAAEEPAPTANGDRSAQRVEAPEPAATEAEVVLGPDGEPLAEWEVELLRQGVDITTTETSNDAATESAPDVADVDSESGDSAVAEAADGDGESRSSRRRRRRRGKNRDEGPQGADADVAVRHPGRPGRPRAARPARPARAANRPPALNR